MHIQVITLTETYIDDQEVTRTEVVKTPKPLTLQDTGLLSYIFDTDVTRDEIELEIEPLETILEEYSENMTTTFMIIEKINNKLVVNSHELPIIDCGKDKLQSLLTSDLKLAGTRGRIASNGPNSNDFAMVFDTKRMYGDLSCLPHSVQVHLKNTDLGKTFTTECFIHSDTNGNHVKNTVIYFLESNTLIEHECTSITQNAPLGEALKQTQNINITTHHLNDGTISSSFFSHDSSSSL